MVQKNGKFDISETVKEIIKTAWSLCSKFEGHVSKVSDKFDRKFVL
jgi:hypothetical protein